MIRSRKRGRCPDERVGSETEFQLLLDSERRRSERSGRPFVILTLQLSGMLQQAHGKAAQNQLLSVVCEGLRATDRIAWHEAGATIGIICTETGSSDGYTAGTTIVGRLRELLALRLSHQVASQIEISFAHSAPDFPTSVRARHSAEELEKAFV